MNSGEATLDLIRLFVVLVGAAALVTLLARRVRLPYTVALVGFGLVQATTADLVVGRWGRKTKAAPGAKAPAGSKGPIGKTPHDGLAADGARGGPAGDGAASPAERGSSA